MPAPESRRVVIKPLTIVLIVVAVGFAAIGVMYLATPAGQLPSIVPGHLAGSHHHHTTHALLMFGLAALALIGAWFTTSPSSPHD
jgi:hypothetical protein